TGICDHDGDEAAVGAVANGGLKGELDRNADEHKGGDLGVAQRELQRGALECRHRELVEDRLRWAGSELWHQLKARRVAQERRDDLLDPVLSLPGHRSAQLRDT